MSASQQGRAGRPTVTQGGQAGAGTSHLILSPCCFSSKMYGITIRDVDQPLLIHRPKARQTPQGKVSKAGLGREVESHGAFWAPPAPCWQCRGFGVLRGPVPLPAASAGHGTARARAYLHDRAPQYEEGQSDSEGQSTFGVSSVGVAQFEELNASYPRPEGSSEPPPLQPRVRHLTSSHCRT